jgi:hypothetical protein
MHCKSILDSEHRLTLNDENRLEHAGFEGNPHGPSALAGIAQIGRVAALKFPLQVVSCHCSKCCIWA